MLINLRLSFGVRSSPYLFKRLANAFQWLLKTNYHIQDLMHYLDEYFTVGAANSVWSVPIMFKPLPKWPLTDAWGSFGYGIFCAGHWIANPWPPLLQN